MLDKIKKTEDFLFAMRIGWADNKERWTHPALREAIGELNVAYNKFCRARVAYEKMEFREKKEREEK